MNTVHPITERVRMPDQRYFALHRKCADGSATSADLDELEAMIAAKEAEYARSNG